MDVLSGLVVGVLGSVHCAGMCGPLAIALPVPQAARMKYITGRVLYNLGRVVTYMLLGAIAGAVGKRLFMAGAQQIVSIVLGILLLIFALAPSVLHRIPTGALLLERLTGPVKRALGTLLQRSSLVALFLFGIVNGILPCGLVYVALAAAITTGDVFHGVLFMAGFGLGTVPVMLAIALLGKQLQGGVRKRLSRLLPVFMTVIAVLVLLRGLNLGIPYVSPKIVEEPRHEQVDCCE
jgi:sulfite exporter TauE/SafE